jgi:hypothetical protein
MTDQRKVLEVPQRLFESEINGEVNWFFDAGFEWTLWDRQPDGGEPESRDADTYEAALTELAEAACARYPDGQFARWWRGTPS